MEPWLHMATYPTGLVSEGRGMNGVISSSSLPLSAQMPLAEECRQSAQQPLAAGCCWRLPVDTRLNKHMAPQTTLLTNGRAKAQCLCEGNPMLLCGTAHLEHLTAPEVTQCGVVQHSTPLTGIGIIDQKIC